jgi:hypothetical protein
MRQQERWWWLNEAALGSVVPVVVVGMGGPAMPVCSLSSFVLLCLSLLVSSHPCLVSSLPFHTPASTHGGASSRSFDRASWPSQVTEMVLVVVVEQGSVMATHVTCSSLCSLNLPCLKLRPAHWCRCEKWWSLLWAEYVCAHPLRLCWFIHPRSCA